MENKNNNQIINISASVQGIQTKNGIHIDSQEFKQSWNTLISNPLLVCQNTNASGSEKLKIKVTMRQTMH